MKHSKTSEGYAPLSVIVIPFPYADNITQSKRRPAVVLSQEAYNRKTGQLICAMITSGKSARWPDDIPITGLAAAGLTAACVIRMKLFTLEQHFVLRTLGKLGRDDQTALRRCLKATLSGV